MAQLVPHGGRGARGPDPGRLRAHLRRGVLEVVAGAAADATSTLAFADKAALADYLGGASAAALVEEGRLEVRGDGDAAARFATYFDEPAHMGRILVTLHGPAPAAEATGE